MVRTTYSYALSHFPQVRPGVGGPRQPVVQLVPDRAGILPPGLPHPVHLRQRALLPQEGITKENVCTKLEGEGYLGN